VHTDMLPPGEDVTGPLGMLAYRVGRGEKEEPCPG